jgi:hypothetical protein
MKPLFLSLVMGLLCTAARATPPDTLSLRDDLFGIAPCCVLVMRVTNDNLGLYDATHRDAVLVVIDRQSGEERQYPVYRITGREAQTQVVPLPGAVDSFALLGSMGGLPLSQADGLVSAFRSVTRDGDRLAVEGEDGPPISAEVSTLLRRLEASMAGLARVLGDYQRPAPVSTADLLQARAGAACDFTAAWRVDDQQGGAPARLVRVECRNDGEITSVILPLR